ncbi:copper resistance protein NlpE [Sphingobacterium paludis]|uniref:copper resistance protein NlpE n=1 Tax=Sphingobacterium paludis TaxID=1476465 RepID=UPI001415026F|nr:copper resistance protein NlpE [Sphingobacterium paludis]
MDLSKPQDDDQAATGTASETGSASSNAQTGQEGTTAAGDNESTTDVAVNPTDFEGSYEGTIPCEDCQGIRTKIVINNNETFQISSEHLGTDKKLNDNGRFKVLENGSILHLRGKDTDLKLKIAKDKLLHLDNKGEVIEGEAANKFVYNKV